MSVSSLGPESKGPEPRRYVGRDGRARFIALEIWVSEAAQVKHYVLYGELSTYVQMVDKRKFLNGAYKLKLLSSRTECMVSASKQHIHKNAVYLICTADEVHAQREWLAMKMCVSAVHASVARAVITFSEFVNTIGVRLCPK